MILVLETSLASTGEPLALASAHVAAAAFGLPRRQGG
jgi:hypothetical protein